MPKWAQTCKKTIVPGPTHTHDLKILSQSKADALRVEPLWLITSSYQGLGKSVLVRSQCKSHIMMFVHNFAYFAGIRSECHGHGHGVWGVGVGAWRALPYHPLNFRFSMGAAMAVGLKQF